jgi:hypothetical protein
LTLEKVKPFPGRPVCDRVPDPCPEGRIQIRFIYTAPNGGEAKGAGDERSAPDRETKRGCPYVPFRR